MYLATLLGCLSLQWLKALATPSDACLNALSSTCPSTAPLCSPCVTKEWRRVLARSCGNWTMGNGIAKHCDVPPPSGPPSGLFKSTWTASDPLNTTWPALMKYLPVTNTADSCKDNHCKCGAAGRTQLVGDMFGIHTVLAAGLDGVRAQPPFTGPLTVKSIEDIFDREMHDMTVYSPWMDYNMALWAPLGTLDSYMHALEQDGFKLLRLSWRCLEVTCYSAIWHIPKSQVVVELISNVTMLPPEEWQHIDEERHIFPTGRFPSSSFMTALHDSRAVTNVSEVVAYYQDILDMTPFKVATYSRYLKVVSFAFKSDSGGFLDATVQYIERFDAGSSLHRQTTPAWFQDYLRQNARKYMTSPNSCWPIWGDNHIAVSSATSIDTVIKRFHAKGWTEYHPFVGMENNVTGFGHTAVYLLDPSGWQIEFNGVFNNPPNTTDKDVGDFDEYCAYQCNGMGAAELIV